VATFSAESIEYPDTCDWRDAVINMATCVFKVGLYRKAEGSVKLDIIVMASCLLKSNGLHVSMVTAVGFELYKVLL
jgi:hypothetical protein